MRELLERLEEKKVDAPGSVWHGAEIISSYTRAQALADGELVDVSGTARQEGFRWPTAFTRALWAVVEKVGKGRGMADIPGIMHDILFLLHMKARGGGSVAKFKCKIGNRNYTIMSMAGPGDRGEPTITVGFPDDF